MRCVHSLRHYCEGCCALRSRLLHKPPLAKVATGMDGHRISILGQQYVLFRYVHIQVKHLRATCCRFTSWPSCVRVFPISLLPTLSILSCIPCVSWYPLRLIVPHNPVAFIWGRSGGSSQGVYEGKCRRDAHKVSPMGMLMVKWWRLAQ